MSDDIRRLWAELAEHWGEDHAEHLETALTRKAYNLENGRADAAHHESLEWLGDRMLDAVVAEELWRRQPGASEQELDARRKHLTSNQALDPIGRAFGLPDGLKTGAGEASNGQLSGKAVADHVEALVGAAFLGGGYAGASALVHRLYKGQWDAADHAKGDAMSVLNELVQKRWKRSLSKNGDWAVVRVGGADNAPEHRATVTLPDDRRIQGDAVVGTKQEARMAAAAKALRELGHGGVEE